MYYVGPGALRGRENLGEFRALCKDFRRSVDILNLTREVAAEMRLSLSVLQELSVRAKMETMRLSRIIFEI